MTDASQHHKEKKFLKLPRIQGGKEQLKKFIRDNLQYPRKALGNNIQGDVIVKYKISGKGEVFDASIVKGIGFGCDEEALRLVALLRYDAVKNRGVKVTAHNKIKIPFRLPLANTQKKIQMVYTPKAKSTDQNTEPNKPKGEKTTYTYTIKF